MNQATKVRERFWNNSEILGEQWNWFLDLCKMLPYATLGISLQRALVSCGCTLLDSHTKASQKRRWQLQSSVGKNGNSDRLSTNQPQKQSLLWFLFLAFMRAVHCLGDFQPSQFTLDSINLLPHQKKHSWNTLTLLSSTFYHKFSETTIFSWPQNQYTYTYTKLGTLHKH